MKGDTAAILALGLLLLLSWRAKAEKEAEITALLYSYNGQDWLPIQGAVIDSETVTIGVQWKSITASMGVAITLSVDGETQEEVLSIDPGDTGRADFSVTLDDGNYTAEVEIKETASGKVLDSRLVSFTVATTLPPVCTDGEYKCVGLDRYVCQSNQWVLYKRNSLACGYVPPPPPAEFVLSNLTVSPAQAQVEDTISISAVVKNIGGAPGDYSVLITCDELVVPIPKTGTLLPGERATISASWIARTEGVHEVTVVSLSATYEVVAVPPPPEPPEEEGHIAGFLILAGNNWQNLSPGTEVKDTITVGVEWVSDMASGEPNIIGHIMLRVTRPDLTEYGANPTSGQDGIVAPGDSAIVAFDIPITQAGNWNLNAGGTIDLA